MQSLKEDLKEKQERTKKIPTAPKLTSRKITPEWENNLPDLDLGNFGKLSI